MILNLSIKFLAKKRQFNRNVDKLNIWGYDSDTMMSKIEKGVKEGSNIPPVELTITPKKMLLTDGNHRVTVYKNLGVKKAKTNIIFKLK